MVYKHTEPENILGETHLCAKLKHFIKLKCQVIFFFVVASLKNWEKIKVSLTELNKKKKGKKLAQEQIGHGVMNHTSFQCCR